MFSRSWIVFGSGLISVPVLLIGSAVLNPQNKPWTAFVVPPLLLISLLCCVAAPLLSPLSRGKKLAFSIGALLGFSAVFLATLLYCAVTFGTGIQ